MGFGIDEVDDKVSDEVWEGKERELSLGSAGASPYQGAGF